MASQTEELIAQLEERGIPQGMWLVEIGQVREALRAADSLLRRLEEAVIRTAVTGGGDDG